MSFVTPAQQISELVDSRIARFSKVVAQFIKMPSKLSLQITRQDRMGYRPRNDGKVIGPAAARRETGETRGEVPKPIAHGVAVAERTPFGDLSAKRHPIFIAVVSVTNLCGNDDP